MGVLLFELHAAVTETGKRKGNPDMFHSALMVNNPFFKLSKKIIVIFRSQEIF